MSYWTRAEDQVMRDNYLKLEQAALLKLLPNRTWDAIVSRAANLKIGSRRAAGLIRKWHWDFDYFEKIDTSEKAYWLGFIYADGSMSDRNVLRIGLVVEGLPQLKRFAAAIGYDGRIEGPYFDKKYNYAGKYTISLSHPKFAKDLQEKGVIPRKTWCVEFPSWLDAALLPHFIRGLYDGDGTISKKTTKYKEKVYETASFGICSAVRKFMEDVVDVIHQQVGVDAAKVIRVKNKYVFNYQGTPALRIRDWMYADATVWMECKREKFYSYNYSSARPQDKEHQTQIIDAEMKRRGWKRLSEYKGYYEGIAIQCDKGHVWTTQVQNFKNECGCPRCCDIASGERMTEMGKENLTEIFAKRGWELLSEYASEGEIQIRCEHGKVFNMKRRSATRPHAQCDCVRTNCLDFGKQKLLNFLATKGWELISDYTGFFEYVTIRCQHGKEFQRLPGNMKPKSKCDCEKLSRSGVRGVYLLPSGRWQAYVSLGKGRQKSIGSFSTKEEAGAAREKYLLALEVA